MYLCIFTHLEVVGRYCETQLHVGNKFNSITLEFVYYYVLHSSKMLCHCCHLLLFFQITKVIKYGYVCYVILMYKATMVNFCIRSEKIKYLMKEGCKKNI